MHKENKEKKESVFYVGMKDPIEIRRSVLESSKEALQYLQRFERFKEVRKEKAEQRAKLREIVSEINGLVRKLKAALPETGLRGKISPKLHKEEQKKEKKPKEAAEKRAASKIESEKPKEMSELEKLEAELGEIEKRLTKLS